MSFDPLDAFREIPIDPSLTLILASTVMTTKRHVEADESLRPTPGQYAMTTGDYAAIPAMASETNMSLTIVQLLDPESDEVKTEYPDYEDRLLGSFVPVYLRDQETPDGYTCWLSRHQLAQLTEDQYQTIRGWLENDSMPRPLPKWLSDVHRKFQAELSASSGGLAAPLACGLCGEYTVVLQFTHDTELSFEVGVHPKHTELIAVDEKQLSHSCRSTATLVCMSCRATKPLTLDKLLVREGSAISRAVAHSHDED